MAIREGFKQYQHAPLSSTTQQFRLLRITSKGSQSVHCTMTVYNRDDCPPYVALSYAWGNISDKRYIIVDDCALGVTRNLYSYLELAATREFSYHSETPTLLWIDQICVDQEFVIEKNHQVQQMASIYSEAAVVVAWLGHADASSNQVMRHITGTVNEYGHFLDGTGMPKEDYSIADQRRMEVFVNKNQHTLVLLSQFSERAYWARLWAIQEFVLAAELTLQCGKDMVPWQTFRKYMGLHSAFLANGYQLHGDRFLRHWLTRVDAFRGVKTKPPTAIIMAVSDLECTDPRDKIYALLGLWDNQELNIKVDYSVSSQELFWKIISAAQAMRYETTDSTLNTVFYLRFRMLGLAMGVSEEDLENSDYLAKPTQEDAHNVHAKSFDATFWSEEFLGR